MAEDGISAEDTCCTSAEPAGNCAAESERRDGTNAEAANAVAVMDDSTAMVRCSRRHCRSHATNTPRFATVLSDADSESGCDMNGVRS